MNYLLKFIYKIAEESKIQKKKSPKPIFNFQITNYFFFGSSFNLVVSKTNPAPKIFVPSLITKRLNFAHLYYLNFQNLIFVCFGFFLFGDSYLSSVSIASPREWFAVKRAMIVSPSYSFCYMFVCFLFLIFFPFSLFLVPFFLPPKCYILLYKQSNCLSAPSFHWL